jgi:uncharacterized membrane protein YedE/YeeE
LFGVGLTIAGMTRPSKVIGFLDIGGTWDPTLALVMVGAIGVHLVGYRWIRRRAAPVFDDRASVGSVPGPRSRRPRPARSRRSCSSER